MAQVYVSYGGKDRGAAQPVIEAMTQAGLDVWHFDEFSAGGSLLEQMRRELDEAQCVVVLWSKAAAQSAYMQQEIHHAIQAWSSDRLVLAALDDTPLPVGLRDLSPISIREASDSGTKQLIERARAIVNIPLGKAPRSRVVAWIIAAALLAGIAVLAAAAAIFYIYIYSLPSAESKMREPEGEGYIKIEPKPYLPADMPLLPLILMLGLGVVTGAGATACIVWLRRRSTSASTTMLVQVPAASDDVRIFVSYSRQDEQTVEHLVRQIEGLGYAVWIDRQSTSAQRYAASIVAAIRASRVVALMCSKNSFTSDHVTREVYVAGDYKKPFIVFQLDSANLPDELLYFVSGFPRLPLATIDQQQLRSEIARLLAA
jgi:TIR domain